MTDKTYEKLKLMDLSEIKEFEWSKLKAIDMESIGTLDDLLAFDWSEIKAIDMNDIHALDDLPEFDWSELKSIDDLSEFDFKASDL